MSKARLARPALLLMAGALLLAGGCHGGGGANSGNYEESADLAAPQVATEYDIVRAMLDLADVKAEDMVVDLGSGDGRIPILAAREKGARALGVELDPERIAQSNRNASQAGVAERVQFHQQDLFVTPLNDATVLTLYLLPEINLQLRPKILAQMKPGTRVVSNSFDMADWRPDQRRDVANTTIFLWVVPAQVEGRWRFQISGGAAGELALNQHYQEFSGDVSGSSRGTISQGRLQGDRIGFIADLGQGRRRYEGRVVGNAIEGDGWRAVKVG